MKFYITLLVLLLTFLLLWFTSPSRSEEMLNSERKYNQTKDSLRRARNYKIDSLSIVNHMDVDRMSDY